MSSPADQSSFILVQRLADGRVEWVPLGTAPLQVSVAPWAAYTLIDRANYEAPQTLVAQRKGEDLVVQVQGTPVLVLGGFFATTDVAFYPTTNIAGGAGPFTGAPLTPASPVPPAAMAGEQVVSVGTDEKTAEDDESGATGAVGSADGEVGGGTSPMLWAGLAAGGVGLLALAGGGGGGQSGEGAPLPGPVPRSASDTVAPQITSGATATAIAENSGPGQVVYTVTATDAGAVTYSLKAGGDAAFSINASTGALALAANPDHEVKSSYNSTVVATDASGNSSERAVSLNIIDLDEVPPTITSSATANAITENSGANQLVYTVTSDDTGDVSGGITYSRAGVDAQAFSINASSGAVRLIANPDFETKSSYNFTVVATDAAGNSRERAVSLAIVDTDDRPGGGGDTRAPTLSSSTPADDAEGVPVGQNIVLTFDENVRTGSGTITIRDGDDQRIIGVNDGSQVSISGNRVTIDPAADLEPDGHYVVRINSGALTDEAGNAFAGIGGNALDFETEQGDGDDDDGDGDGDDDDDDDDDDDPQSSNSDPNSRSFQGVSFETEIRVDIDDATPSTAGGGLGIWNGSAGLGSDDRITFVGNGADAQRPSEPPIQVSVTEPAQTTAGSEAGSLQGAPLTRVTGDSAGATLFDFTNMPAGILTSQGLV